MPDAIAVCIALLLYNLYYVNQGVKNGYFCYVFPRKPLNL